MHWAWLNSLKAVVMRIPEGVKGIKGYTLTVPWSHYTISGRSMMVRSMRLNGRKWHCSQSAGLFLPVTFTGRRYTSTNTQIF